MIDLIPVIQALGLRKRLLFGCGLARSLDDLFPHASCRAVVAAAERVADGDATFDGLRAAVINCNRSLDDRELTVQAVCVAEIVRWLGRHGDTSWRLGQTVVFRLSRMLDSFVMVRGSAAAARTKQRRTLRSILADISRPSGQHFSSQWRTSAVVHTARAIYESRDFSPMPILADALQEAGCENVKILAHCRTSRPHGRGCWVVDAILGRR